MARRKRSRQIEIFNFSFLDILACTIGLLIFIMVMVFILQSGSPVADTVAVVRHKSEEARRQRLSADEDSAIASQLEEQLSRIHDAVRPDLRSARDSAAQQAQTARADYEGVLSQLRTTEAELENARGGGEQKSDTDLRDAEARLKEARARNEAAKALVAQANGEPPTEHVQLLPKQKDGEASGGYDVLHLDCRSDSIVVLGPDAEGNFHESGHFQLSDLGDKDSALQRTIDAHALVSNSLVLLWVRPDGVETFKKVRDALPEGLAFGYEPMDASQHFPDAARQ
jgi:hypothetical protein